MNTGTPLEKGSVLEYGKVKVNLDRSLSTDISNTEVGWRRWLDSELSTPEEAIESSSKRS